jgi:ubiquinone/menaquinone biosynthesis C-methylase UbiE
MGSFVTRDAIVALYDAHPVGAPEILDELVAQGKRLDDVAPEDLFALDQDHYGGARATEALALAAGVGADDAVLDLCAGIGGPARFVAHRFGCRVTGIELVPSRVADAGRLTELVGMGNRVMFVEGDVTALPFPDGSFDACLSQESFLHVADKRRLFGECRRVLRQGGRLGFSDWVAGPTLAQAERDRLATAFSAAGIVSLARYLEELDEAGFAGVEVDDLAELWKPSLRERLALLRARREQTAARVGEEAAASWEAEYAFMVDLVHEGKLGGARLVAAAP